MQINIRWPIGVAKRENKYKCIMNSLQMCTCDVTSGDGGRCRETDRKKGRALTFDDPSKLRYILSNLTRLFLRIVQRLHCSPHS